MMNRLAPRPAARILFCTVALPLIGLTLPTVTQAALRAGAAAVDTTPTTFPVTINGGFLPVVANNASDPLHARALALADEKTALVICVVDSCLMPRDLLDEVKARASKSTGIPASRMLISATHTHTAPAVMGALGTDVDANYPPFLKDRLVQAIERAHKNLAPATAAWGVANAADYTGCRRWIRRPDRMLRDPFGALTVRANMHPGHQSADAIGPSGPEDPDLTVLSIRGTNGRPVALLANFAMHYFGGPAPVSSDYFGPFCNKVATLIKADAPGGGVGGREPPFVGIMSQGTSGDLWRVDYAQPKSNVTLDEYAGGLAKLAVDAVSKAEYRADVTLAMAQREIAVKARGPGADRLAWARKTVDGMNGRPPKSHPEIYAREQIFLSERPAADMLLQAIRVGDFGITAMPCEVYALTGLKIKAQSPLTPTMNVELANDELGYIPPPEQHKLGGYTTWPARSSYPDVDAEPRMVEAVLQLLEEVAGRPRRAPQDAHGPYAKKVLEAKPLAYWRGHEMSGPAAFDATGRKNDATYEDGVVFHLEGPASAAFGGEGVVNRAPHLAGGRMTAELKGLGDKYAIAFWFWNGLANDARPITAYLFSRGADGDKQAAGDHLGIGGTHAPGGEILGRLIFFNGNERGTTLVGRSVIAPRTWNHVVLVRDGAKVAVHLNGAKEPEVAGEAEVGHPPGVGRVFFGGRNDNFANLEGKLDECAIFDRPLTADEVAAQFASAGVATAPPAPARAALPPPTAPRSAEEALRTLRVKEGYAVELVAAEPLVKDPVAIAFGTDGKLWVAEMADYPYGIDGKMKSSGRVRFLQDADGDGRYDKSTVLLENVNFPTGVLPWRKGVIVTAAPEIFYAEDADGDGSAMGAADVRKVLVSGFTQANPQLRVNTLAWGLDNWVHVANGMGSHGSVRSFNGTEARITGRDLRFRPDDGAIEAESGMTEFGRARDDWGNWFGCDNSHPIWHFVLAERYARRNPHVAATKPTDAMGLGPNPQVFPISTAQKRYHSFEHGGRYTSACSATIYRDELLFPRTSSPDAFVCEPVHNLVQHLVLKPSGVTFAASRAADEPGQDFLASDDPWFRPVFVTTGPNGALWVADMYRHMIEHPDWLPQQGKDELRPVYRLGDDRGRIYRVHPKGRPPRPIPRLDKLDAAGLVAAMDSPNGWQRDAAQQRLIWQNDPAAAALLRRAAAHQNALVRLQALSTLDGLNALEPADVEAALRDGHPAIRRHALQWAEPRAKTSPRLIGAAVTLAEDPDPAVRLQLACTLGEWDAPAAGAALARLALAASDDDAHATAAVLSSASRHYAAVADALLQAGRPMTSPLLRDLMKMAVALNDRPLLARLASPALAPAGEVYAAAQFESVGRFLDDVAAHRSSVQILIDAKADPLSDALKQLPRAFEAARRAAGDAALAPDVRMHAVALLGREAGHADEDLRLLASLLTPQTPTAVQTAAARGIAKMDRPDVPPALTSGWAAHSPAVRAAVVDALLSREPWAWEILEAIGSARIATADLDAARRQQLVHHASKRVRERAGKLIGETTDAGRLKVIDDYRPALTLAGDAARGAKVFAQNCATCHRLGDVGQDIGPSLRSVAGWPAENLLAAVLDPNRAAEPRFLAYAATLAGGETAFGVIAAETDAGLTLRGLDGKERTLLRAQVQSLVGTNRSLMPDGLEAAVTPQAMADLFAFIRAPGGKG